MGKDYLNISTDITDDIEGMIQWYKEEYSNNFEVYFKGVKDLYTKLNKVDEPISNKDLEFILSELPLNMFSVAESLNSFKLSAEVIKLKIKEIKRDVKANSEAKTQTLKNEEADNAVLELEVLLKGYSAVIERVDRESTFCKELIMSAKKIYTQRMQSDADMNVLETTTSNYNDLPDYRFDR